MFRIYDIYCARIFAHFHISYIHQNYDNEIMLSVIFLQFLGRKWIWNVYDIEIYAFVISI